MAGSLLDEVAGPAPAPQPNAPASPNQGSLLDQVAAEAPKTANPVNTIDTATPSYLDEVQNHVTNTAKALWHGITGDEETEAERGAPTSAPPKQLGFTNENVAYNIGNLGHGVAGFLGGVAHDLISTKMPAIMPDEKKISWTDPKANTLLGKYITAPSAEERQKALAEAEAYTKSKGAEAIGHLLNTYVHTAGEYVPIAGPFVASLVDKAESGDVGGAVSQVAAMAAAHPVKGAIDETLGRTPSTDATWNKLKLDALNSTVKGPMPKTPGTVAGERTTLRPTTQKTAGVEAPISAIQQENPSVVTKGATRLMTTPGTAEEFQKTKTAPAATRQLTSTIGQVAEDKINRHNAIMDGRPTPDQIAGTQTLSKFQTHDEAAQAAEATAQKTYKKADVASDADIAAWQHTVKEALNDHKDLLDRHNANIDAYNANLSEGEEPMPHAVYDPNAVSIPEKPQSYSELKAELDRAKADSNSQDAAIREDAYKTGIPKAEKAIDSWFKQHSDVISPAEYDSAKKLYADSQRFQEIANGLRGATAKGTITGNTLRGLEANIDNKMIRRGQGPGAFKRLLGEEGYDNWQNVTKLFDPIKGAPKGIKAWGIYALEVAASHLVPFGMTGTIASKFLMDRIMFNPAWGQWFSKLATNLKDAVTREHGELGPPGTVGEPFGEGGAGREFEDLMNQAQGKAAAEVKAQAQPQTSSLLDEVAKPEPTVTHDMVTDAEGKPDRLEIMRGDEPIGHIKVEEQIPGTWTVKDAVVKNGETGKGYGIGAYKQLIQEAQKAGVKTIESDVSNTTKAAGVWQALQREFPNAVREENGQYSLAVPESYTGEERRAGSRSTMSAAELEDAIKNRRPISNPFDQTEGARATMNRDPNMPQPPQAKTQTVGTPEGAARDTAFFQQARTELGDTASFSDIAKRAQELKTAALPEARPVTKVSPEYTDALKSKEIATSNPQTVNADTTNNPDRTSGMKTLNDAPPKLKATIAQAVANYKDTGLKLTPEELETPAEHANSIIKKAVAHYKDNLVALYNAIPESIRGISKQWYESAHDLSKGFANDYGLAHEQAAAVIAALSPNNPWDNNVGMAQRLMERWKNDRGRIWDEKMDEKLSAIRNAKSTKPEFRGFLDSVRGKSYDELQGDTPAETSVMRGLWLRMADQAYGSPEIPVYAPDGTIRGSQKIAWGPYDAVAKAVNLLDDGSIENINRLMGNGHKIRNFYNNIINPWSDRGHVTIDTHAVGAAHWKPFSQKDTEVAHNFGGSTPGVPGAGKHAGTGLGGSYPVYDEAYKQAAKEVGVSPREMQSITWEGIRSLFSREGKKGSIRKDAADIWRQASEGKITKDEARKQIIEKAGGFKRPVWTTDSQWNASQK